MLSRYSEKLFLRANYIKVLSVFSKPSLFIGIRKIYLGGIHLMPGPVFIPLPKVKKFKQCICLLLLHLNTLDQFLLTNLKIHFNDVQTKQLAKFYKLLGLPYQNKTTLNLSS